MWDIRFAWMSWTLTVICFFRLYITVYCKKIDRSIAITPCKQVFICQITLCGGLFTNLKVEKLLKCIILLINPV